MSALLRHRLSIAIALCALLWHALGPALLHALPARSVQLPFELCTFAGLQQGQALQINISTDDAALSAKQCPLCLLSSLLALPLAALFFLQQPLLRRLQRQIVRLLPPLAATMQRPTARGPPLLS